MKLSFYKNLSFTNFKASMFLLTFSELLLGSLYFFQTIVQGAQRDQDISH